MEDISAAQRPNDAAKYNWLELMLEHEQVTARQRAILQAAAELFSQKGYAATSTKEIAQKAGVAEATIFKHYATKKKLMLYLTERIIRIVMVPFISSGLANLLGKPYDNRGEFLSALMKNRMALMSEGIPLIKIIFQEVPFQPEIQAMLVEQIRKMPLSAIAKKLQTEGSTDYSEEEIAQFLLTCVMGFFFMRHIMLPELFPAERLPEDMEALARFINRGLQPETGG